MERRPRGDPRRRRLAGRQLGDHAPRPRAGSTLEDDIVRPELRPPDGALGRSPPREREPRGRARRGPAGSPRGAGCVLREVAFGLRRHLWRAPEAERGAPQAGGLFLLLSPPLPPFGDRHSSRLRRLLRDGSARGRSAEEDARAPPPHPRAALVARLPKG